MGGTNYYIEAVLWRLLVADRAGSEGGSGDDSGPADGASSEDGSDGDGGPADPPAGAADRSEGVGSVSGGGPADSDRLHLERLSTEELYARLRERDPAQAQVLHPNERRKILR